MPVEENTEYLWSQIGKAKQALAAGRIDEAATAIDNCCDLICRLRQRSMEDSLKARRAAFKKGKK